GIRGSEWRLQSSLSNWRTAVDPVGAEASILTGVYRFCGIQSSAPVGTWNAFGMIPMIVNCCSLTFKVLPMVLGSPPNRRCQREAASTTTCASAFRYSSATNTRPIIGRTFASGKKALVTSVPFTLSVDSPTRTSNTLAPKVFAEGTEVADSAGRLQDPSVRH